MCSKVNCLHFAETLVSQFNITAAATAKSLQSCPALCNHIDGSPPGSPIPGILQARTLEWVAISFSNAWKWKVKGKLLSRVRLLATPWTAAYQAPPSMGFSRQEYWSGVPLPYLTLFNIFLFKISNRPSLPKLIKLLLILNYNKREALVPHHFCYIYTYKNPEKF